MGKKKAYREPILSWEEVFIAITGFIIIIILIGVFSSWSDILFLPGTVSADGTILSCQIQEMRGVSYCQATIQFYTQAGQSITFSSSMGNSQPGDIVSVRYHPNNPGDARVDSLLSDFLLAGISSGVLGVDLCVFAYWKRRKRKEYIRIHKGLAKNTRLPDKKQKKPLKRHQRYEQG